MVEILFRAWWEGDEIVYYALRDLLLDEGVTIPAEPPEWAAMDQERYYGVDTVTWYIRRRTIVHSGLTFGEYGMYDAEPWQGPPCSWATTDAEVYRRDLIEALANHR